MEFSIQEDGMNGDGEGKWKYRVICEEAINGKYCIQCKRKD